MFNLTVDTAHTFYVGANGWLVHNCGPTAAQLSVEARLAQEKLARTEGMGRSVVAAAWDYDQEKMVFSVTHSDAAKNEAAVNILRRLGYDVLDAAPKSTAPFHAERQLDSKGFDIIGVSRSGNLEDSSTVAGLCSGGPSSCQAYFSNKPYTSISSFKPQYKSLPRFKIGK